MKSINRTLLLAVFALSLALSLTGLQASLIGTKLPDTQGNYYTWQGITINLRIVDGHFIIYFLDAESKIIAPVPAVNEASVRWEGPKYVYVTGTKVRKPRSEEGGTLRTREGDIVLLSPSQDNDCLKSDRAIPPRSVYYVFLSLLQTGPNNKSTALQVFDRQELQNNSVLEDQQDANAEEPTQLRVKG